MDFARLDAYLDEMTVRYAMPAIDVAVDFEGKEVYRRMIGFADSAGTRPVSRGDMYILYSATKVFTGVCLAQLLESGKISLDDRAEKYIPSIANLRVATRDAEGRITGSRPSEKPMLIRHLATMTGGLTYNFDTPYLRRAVEEGNVTTRRGVEAILEEPLLFEPGDSFHYSFCLDVIGAIVEVVSGMRFSDYVKKYITDPLELSDITFHPTAEQRERLTAQYFYDGRDPDGRYRYREVERVRVTDRMEDYESGGGGLYATVDDYLAFASALANFGVGRNGNRILTREGIEMLRKPMLTSEQRRAYDGMGKYGTSYGLGVRTTVNPERFGFRTPVGEFGWDGKAAAYVSVYPEGRLAMFLGMQVCDFGEAFGVIHHKLRELTYEAAGYPEQHLHF